MVTGTHEVAQDSQLRPWTIAPVVFEAPTDVLLVRRREGRAGEQKLCTYALCEILEDQVVIQEGEAYSLNRSVHGILILMGNQPRDQQLLEVQILESRWRRSLNLYEVQWTKPVCVEEQGDLFLVGCRLTFGSSTYWAF